jgi:hypothetical protein
MRATYVALLHGSSLRFGLCCPEPSSLNRPDPPHSQAQHNFIALRLICAAFAVRERLGDPRAVPRFRLSILPSMSSSTSPGSRPLHVSSSFAVRICLRRGVIGSALPMLAISGLTGSPLLRPAELLASLTGDFYFRAFNGLVTLPVAGYDYGGNWTISTAGLTPAGPTTSVAAQLPPLHADPHRNPAEAHYQLSMRAAPGKCCVATGARSRGRLRVTF